MLLDGATVQVSFLKDLVTMRNPNSPFSFVSYLHAKNRLADFVNHKSLFPSRIEFNDYLEWAAGYFAEQVEYGAEVLGIRPVVTGDRIRALEVTTRSGDGALRVRRGRNVVIATGLRPVLPPGVVESARIWHSDRLLSGLAEVAGRQVRRVVVVGAGQSAAEAVEYLHRYFDDAEVCAVFTRVGYSPADDSPFVNTVFDPVAVDDFYDARDEAKRLVLSYHANTNYSVVDTELIEELYRRSYQEKVTGHQRLRMLKLSRVVSVTDSGGRARAVVESLASGTRTVLDADLVVFATGYREADVFGLLGELGEFCVRDEQGRPRMSRDYRIETVAGVDCGIYLQGPTEHTHGIGSGLLSLVAVRAGEIIRSIAAQPRQEPLARNGSAERAGVTEGA
jgi:L-ornithine N5-oxygenase